MKIDCIYYEYEKCSILKKMYCKNQKCSFYKQDKIKTKREKTKKCTEQIKKYKTKKITKTKMTDEERKAKRKEYGKFYYQKHKLNNDNHINYINYGELIFSDEEIKALKSRKLKIF